MRDVIIRLCAVAVLGLSVSAQPSHAIENGTTTRQPAAVSAAAPLRQALIVAPAPGGGAMAFDADGYDTLLRILGFSVTTVVSETRPELEGDLRRFAAAVKPGGEVALFLLGTLPTKGDQLYLIPTVSAVDVSGRPDLLSTEGVSVSDLLRRIGERGPKDIVAVVDTCRSADAASDCQKVAAAFPDGVSALVASRRRGTDAGGPLARLASLRPDLTSLMRQPDLSFFALFAALKVKLSGTDMTLSATPSLSRSFAFLPSDFLAKLPTACNRVEATSDPAALRGRRLDELENACAGAARSYAFTPYFPDKLATVREQLAFQRTMANGCSSMALADFLRDYPGSRLRDAVENYRMDCERARRDADERAAAQRAAALQEQAALEQKAGDEAAREQADREEEQRRLMRTNGLVARGDIQPSFPCSFSIREPVAQLICADADLASADAQLGSAYSRALASAFMPAARRNIALAERAWVRQRTAVCGIPTSGTWDIDALAPMKACLLKQTRQRTSELER